MVLSSEKPRCSLIPVEQLSHDPHELQVSCTFVLLEIQKSISQRPVFSKEVTASFHKQKPRCRPLSQFLVLRKECYDTEIRSCQARRHCLEDLKR